MSINYIECFCSFFQLVREYREGLRLAVAVRRRFGRWSQAITQHLSPPLRSVTSFKMNSGAVPQQPFTLLQVPQSVLARKNSLNCFSNNQSRKGSATTDENFFPRGCASPFSDEFTDDGNSPVVLLQQQQQQGPLLAVSQLPSATKSAPSTPYKCMNVISRPSGALNNSYLYTAQSQQTSYLASPPAEYPASQTQHMSQSPNLTSQTQYLTSQLNPLGVPPQLSPLLTQTPVFFYTEDPNTDEPTTVNCSDASSVTEQAGASLRATENKAGFEGVAINVRTSERNDAEQRSADEVSSVTSLQGTETTSSEQLNYFNMFSFTRNFF